MTHALHELLGTTATQTPDHIKSEDVDELGREIRYTAEELRTHQVQPEIIDELKKAVGILMQTEASDYQKLLPAAEAAAVTGDVSLKAAVGNLLQEAFPVGDAAQDKGLNGINRTTHREFVTAIEMTGENMSFPLALSRAAIMSESITGQDFDMTIKQSNGLMREQRRREAEERKLRELGVYDDAEFDDAERYDPFPEDKERLKAA